jgi:HAD superfamily phosphoserine phosphatase-like hydrolase
MLQATVLFDFDSTLVPRESFTSWVEERFREDPTKATEARSWTEKGMAGQVPFQEALEAKLRLAEPKRNDLVALGEKCAQELDPEMVHWIQQLQKEGNDIRILSGGFVLSILPSAQVLGIPPSHVHAVEARFSADGTFLGLPEKEGFHTSKVAGLLAERRHFPSPSVLIGDGATDRAVWEQGLVDFFIAFTRFARRPEILQGDCPEAPDLRTLQTLVQELLLS